MRTIALGAGLMLCSCGGSAASVGPADAADNHATATAVDPGPADPPGTSFEGVAGGCRDLFAYRANMDGRQVVTVSIDAKKVGLTVGGRTRIDLGQRSDDVLVGIDVYATAPASAYCTEAAPTNHSVTQWTAESGTLTIELAAEPSAPGSTAADSDYRATITLRDMHLTGPERGIAAVVPQVTMANVRVGWYPG